MPRTFTGIKPTGRPHLGNYLGMIRPALELARSGEALHCIVDYHALTITPDPAEMRHGVLDLTATLIAFGLDTERTVLYRQSDLPEVCELTWILGCTCPKGVLNRAHAYKAATADNLAHGRDADHSVGMGLFNYPVLMAADILIHDAEAVPVGRDQRQHVEIARDLAESFNRDAPSDQIRRWVSRIVTDSRSPSEPKEPDTILALYRNVAPEAAVQDLERRYREGGVGYAEAKAVLAEAIDTLIAPARQRHAELMADPACLQDILARGAARARASAAGTLRAVRAATGLGCG